MFCSIARLSARGSSMQCVELGVHDERRLQNEGRGRRHPDWRLRGVHANGLAPPMHQIQAQLQNESSVTSRVK